MAIVAAIVLGKALRASEVELGDRRVPLAGVCAAFIFAAQMVNFPVASGTTGHLLGGALAAILLGPWVGSLVVAIVVVVQALVFADGGLTALGYNTVNMAVVPALPAGHCSGVPSPPASQRGRGRGCRRWRRASPWCCPPWPSRCNGCSEHGPGRLRHRLRGDGRCPCADRRRGGGHHRLVVAAVMASRPDLVVGAADLSPTQLAGQPRVANRGLPSAPCSLRSCSPRPSASSPPAIQTALSELPRTRASPTRLRPNPSPAASSPTMQPEASTTRG